MECSALLNSGPVSRGGKKNLRKVKTMEGPFSELIIEGNKIQPSEGPLQSPRFKGFIEKKNIIHSTLDSTYKRNPMK